MSGWDDKVEAGNTKLMDDAPDTAALYMRRGREFIDEQFGVGYAAKHPELLAAFMTTTAMDMAGAIIARALDHMPARLSEITHGLEGSLQDVCGAITDAAAK